MARVVKITVPEEVEESEIARWVAEGLSRKVMRRLILESLSRGVDVGVDLERALREFERTRSEVWKRIEEEYREKGLI